MGAGLVYSNFPLTESTNMTVPMTVAEASAAHDTPTIEVVARSLPELHDLLTRPRAEGEPLHVRLAGPAAAELFGVGVAVRVAATGGEAVAR
ncbi:Uncharacterised protein [Mycobacteroides abscessus subsp. abscessus]|nr:Uncharacterised protein [Mycobacteroides abscessus subsp. abscessus]SIH62879.1 Uncharacterised protein [Mycobacteroides abscessus subsp. abscessus]SIM66233.1 Uncharacterised protein [Mycobacteroides abscessus subsp. abscessus]